MGSGKDVRYVEIDDRPSGKFGESDGRAGAQGHSVRKLEGHQTYGKNLALASVFLQCMQSDDPTSCSHLDFLICQRA